ISAIVFACVAGSAVGGMLLRRLLPEHHLSAESQELMKLGTGLIGTMAALVLGLMVSSAKSSYDAQATNFMQLSVKLILLGRALAHCGPEANELRKMLHGSVERIVQQMWPDDVTQSAHLDPTLVRVDSLYNKLQELEPKTNSQRSIHAQALTI